MQQKYKKNSNKSTMKYIRFPNEVLKQIESENIPNFSAWVIKLCKNELKNPSKSTN